MNASAFAAAFPTASTDRIKAIIASAAPWFDVGAWGAFYDEGLWNFVAHRLSLEMGGPNSLQQGADARITSKTIGSESVSRDTKLSAGDTFQLTIYGQRYAEMRDMVGLGGTSSGSTDLLPGSAVTG